MLCANMLFLPDRIAPCGQCMNCRINTKRKLIAQLVMEQKSCENNSAFVTLTYAPENLPANASLAPRDMALFLHRLRKDRKHGLGSIRYFYVGEYGERTQRPHYHMALFNVTPERAEHTCRKLWSKNGEPIGHVHVGEITTKSISYIAGYCLKKMGKNDRRLKGRHPEFGRRSKFPPLGAAYVQNKILPALRADTVHAAIREAGKLPAGFRHEKGVLPFPDYWRRFLWDALLPGIRNPGIVAGNPFIEGSFEQFVEDIKDAQAQNAKHEVILKKSQANQCI